MKETSYFFKYLRRKGHCAKTENCADDMYCSCPCDACKVQLCFRPGCRCIRQHPEWNP